MTSTQFNTGKEIVDLGDGILVEKDVLGIVEKIRAYDPSLDVVCLDPSRNPGLNEAPYIVVEHCPDGLTRRVLEAWVLDGSVYDRVVASDNQKNNLVAVLDGRLQEIRNTNERKFRDEREAAKDIVAHVARNHKTTYTFPNSEGDIVTLDSHLGVTKRVDKS